jgi:DivIVA domain-containing protein
VDNDVPPVTAPQFAVADRGYDREQVDDFVSRLQQKLDDARERLRVAEADHALAFEGLQRRIEELEAAEITGEPATTERDYRALGTRIGHMLELADAEADALRARAARDAEEVVAGARRDAEEIVAGARREAERLTQEEHEKREQLQRQLRALHESLASILGILPADVAAAAGVVAPAEVAASEESVAPEPPEVIDLTDPAPAPPRNDVSLDDLLDDSTQVVHVIGRDGE